MGDGFDGFDGFGQDTAPLENAAIETTTSIIRGLPRLLGLQSAQPVPVPAPQASGLPFGLSIGALIAIGVGAYLLLARR